MCCFNKRLPVIKRHPETRELAELLEREQQIIDLITTCANRLQGMVDDYWWLDRGTKIGCPLVMVVKCALSIELMRPTMKKEWEDLCQWEKRHPREFPDRYRPLLGTFLRPLPTPTIDGPVTSTPFRRIPRPQHRRI